MIQIITKRGQSGRPAFDFTVKQGANYLPNPERVFPDVWGRDPATGELVSLNIIANDIATGHGSPFSTGHVQEYGVSVSGGSEAIRYYLSTDYDSSEGIVSYNWQNRLNTRANLTYNAGDQLQLDFNLGMLRQQGRSASTVQPITTHIVWGSPGQLNTRFRGYLAQVPEAYHDVVGIEQVDRSIGNVRITHTPFGWLSHRLTVGGDFGNSRSHGYWPRHPDGAQGPFGTNSLGRKQVTNLRNSFITTDYSATATVEPRPGITFATSAGAQYYQRQTQIDQSLGLIFPVPGVETVSGAASRFADEDFLENKTFGLFLQEQIGLGNRLFLTAAIRGDDNSAFGENYEFVMYPKLSASYVISEEPFFEGVPLLNTLKLRGAWGRAGQQPDVFAAIRVYQPTTGPGGVPTLTPQNIGNPDLRPEVGEELEFGFDASLLNDRLALEFTYYNQTTRDAIVPRSVLPSIGFPGVQFVNLGEINNQGIELGLNANVLQLPHYNWDLGFTFSTNRNVVRSLGGVTMPSNALGQRHMEGFPLGSIFLQKVVQAEFDADGRVMNMLCEGGDPVTGGGPAVPCSEAGTAYWGQPLPRWEGSVYSNLTLFRNFTLHALVDFVGGFQRVNGDLAASHIFFRNSRTINEGSDPILAAYDRRNQIWQTGIHDGGFAKLRNVSGTYTLPSTWAQRLGASRGSVTLSADNLRTLWIAEDNTFGHRITDPEIRSNNDGLNAFNQEKWPQFTRVLATFRLSY
ncbi:MAG: TonB-dependent receptor [Gemmatimonadetes bacterium]|nr:TonB-dependent receptor [Gemmatimonadota bacterium]